MNDLPFIDMAVAGVLNLDSVFFLLFFFNVFRFETPIRTGASPLLCTQPRALCNWEPKT